jgi:hypothetical protein
VGWGCSALVTDMTWGGRFAIFGALCRCTLGEELGVCYGAGARSNHRDIMGYRQMLVHAVQSTNQ